MIQESDPSDLSKRKEIQTAEQKPTEFTVKVDPECKLIKPTEEEVGWHEGRFGGDPNKE
jgi:hypothetical protein